ncbi:hypothetical protein ACFQ08_04050 [Streptosporangium algeriense]|uniref:Uncharacterized protein n=1 Tax=Streptosporangium algeriense TaxID=1682748 RepID=A0ABW3DIJ1_9ACTN
MATICIYTLIGTDLAPMIATRIITLTPEAGPRIAGAIVLGSILLWPLALVLLLRRPR